MDPVDPRPLNNNSTLEKTPIQQVMACKAAELLRVMRVVQRAALKSCSRACQLLCLSVDTLLCDVGSGCTAQKYHHQPTEASSPQVVIHGPPATVVILNIQNSTLIDCVIGNETYKSVVTEKQPLMQKPDPQMHDEVSCCCRRGHQEAAQTSSPPHPPPPPPSYIPIPTAEPPNVSIHSSHLNCVIIGDNNSMHAEQTCCMEADETV